MPTIICKNCDHHFKGNFCPTCGQPATVEHIGFKYFIHDIPHSIFHVDKGFFYTFKELILRPGKTLREYLDGKRIKHYRPFAYVLLMATIYILATKGLHYLVKIIEAKKGYEVNISNGSFFQQYLSVFLFLMIPFASLVTWLVLIKERYNYWEHFLVNTYVTAQLTIVFLFMEIIRFFQVIITNNGGAGFNVGLIITPFMFYIAFIFKNLINPNKGHRLRYSLEFSLICFFLAFIYISGMSLTDIMEPWWGK
jgi:Protein of unknown function (DUF3667)